MAESANDPRQAVEDQLREFIRASDSLHNTIVKGALKTAYAWNIPEVRHQLATLESRLLAYARSQAPTGE